MDIVDLHNPQRVNRTPDAVEILLSSGKFVQDEFVVSNIELRLYVEHKDEKLGQYSLITSFVETDKGTVETIYDEGYRGDDPLSRAKDFLVSNLGLSSLILRSAIILRGHLE